MALNWMKCGNDHWCRLELLKLSTVAGAGVYIIWHSGEAWSGAAEVVYVGQSDHIAQRLEQHRNNPDILDNKKRGTLLVTWADVPKQNRDGVERYFAEKWVPLIGRQYPDVPQIQVNAPWT